MFISLGFYILPVKTTFEDVFPAEATTVEEYLQQVISFFLNIRKIDALKDKNKNGRGKILADFPNPYKQAQYFLKFRSMKWQCSQLFRKLRRIILEVSMII